MPPSVSSHPAQVSETGSIADINAKNAEFWDRIQKLTEDTAVFEVAVELERQKRFAFLDPTRFFETLLDAKTLSARLIKTRAQKGGQAKKEDALTALIRKWVDQNPEITLAQVEIRIRDHAGIDPIADVAEGEISVSVKGGRLKPVPMSGLKDRLSRIKLSRANRLTR